MANRIETGIKQVFQRPNGLFVFCKHHKNTNIQISLSTRDAWVAALMARNLMMVYLQHQDEELESIRSRLYACRTQLQKAQLVGFAPVALSAVATTTLPEPTEKKEAAPKRKRKRLTLSAVLEEYLKCQKADWRGKTYSANEAKCRYFITLVGDRLITDISKSDVSDFKQHLIDRGSSPNTCNDYFIKVSGLFTFAATQREYLTRSPFDGMGFKRVTNLKPRRGIKKEEHQQAVNGFPERSQNWWLLQLLYYTGCRISEIVQLTPRDYRQIDGVWCISINDDGAKTIKNEASRRNIPIHHDLIALEVLEDKPTFSYTPDRASQLVSSIYTGLDVTAHSYRYRMSDRLRNVEASDYVRFALLGHAHKTTTDRVYRSDGAIRRLKEAVDKT
ncbi:TPA: site-specific integrase [Serratia marcescens]